MKKNHNEKNLKNLDRTGTLLPSERGLPYVRVVKEQTHIEHRRDSSLKERGGGAGWRSPEKKTAKRRGTRRSKKKTASESKTLEAKLASRVGGMSKKNR